MRQVEAELDRYLVLLGNLIRQRGYTQLEVQQELHWGRSYISQLVTKQKGLRMEQVLLILRVIGVEPAEFFGELYRWPAAPTAAPVAARGAAMPGAGEEELRQLREVKMQLQGLLGLMEKKGLIESEELRAAMEAAGVEARGRARKP